ncbi:sensor histidine kinase [Flavobacterium caeni]|nr:ATP-binding protein [Flavobacterium caeni]
MDTHLQIDFRDVFGAQPGMGVLVQADAPRFSVVTVTEEFTRRMQLPSQDIGRGLSEMIAERFPVAISKQIRDAVDSCLRSRQKSAMSISSEASGLGADNQLLSVSKIIYSPVVDESGSVPYIILTFTDEKPLADQIELAEILSEHTKELADANQRLRNSNAELEQFAYIASHDLQEPLRKINMFAGLLGNALENPNERIQKYLANIGVSVQRMTNLIQDVLSYSQLSRKQEVFRTTDLNEIFRETLADFDLIVDEKNAKVVSANLPVIDAIPLQMVQLFHNLISNALKYQKPDVAPRIDISWFALTEDRRVELGLPQLEKGYCGLVFADNGIGFSEEYEQKIFNIFQRLHGKGQYEGTGIGLAMCKKIAENHHGLIYARGKEGEGASFTVVLPFDRP